MIRFILAFPFILAALVFAKVGEFIGGKEIDFNLEDVAEKIKDEVF